MPTPPSDLTMAILASIPCEPASIRLDDLMADHKCKARVLSQSLSAIEGRFGLIRKVEAKMTCLSIPATTWEQAEAEAQEWWDRTEGAVM